MPALAHIRSTLPHSLVARSTMAVTCSKFDTSAPSAIAMPPALRISSTTASAGESEPPLPSRAPPKSLTTTFAPRLASPSACALPRPLPAPVTMATRPSNLIAMSKELRERFGQLLSSDGLPGQARPSLREIDQPEPVRDECGLFLALDLDRHVGAGLQFIRLAQLGFGQHETAADALARTDRRDEAQLVEAVIDAHRGARDDRHHLI